jgi:type IV pilus assembly protein PilY1
LRGGGQGIYALDITTPPSSSTSESAVADQVMWEFTDANDSDLGYTFGEVNIVRMHNGKWAAVFGNGYNNTETGNASTAGNAALFIVDLSNGSLIRKIDTLNGMAQDPKGQSRPNGLAAPAPVDVDGDYIVDYIYAGDLFGNLWKFDVRGDDSDWGIAYGSSSNPEPLYVASSATGERQPITSRPQVGRHPLGYPDTKGVIVYFGTGQYIEVGDNTPVGQTTQTFYGIWDALWEGTEFTAFTRSHLLQQQIIEEATAGDFEYRITTNDPITWHTNTGLPTDSPPSTHLGWYLDLINTESNNTDNQGERHVTNSVLRGGRIVFTTLIPNQLVNACDAGGTGWLMELDATNGGRLSFTPFDVNGDGRFSEADYIEITDAEGNTIQVPTSGRKSTVGIIPSPGIVQDAGGSPEYKYTSGSTGEVETTLENPGRGAVGRQSWRQLR